MLTIQFSSSLRYLILLPFFILIISGMIVPSDGGHGILNIKSLAYLGTVVSLFFYMLVLKKFEFHQVKMILFLLCSLAFFFCWIWINILNEEQLSSTAIDQFKVFWLTVSVVAFSYYLVTEKLIKFSTFLKMIFFANFTYSFAKVSLVVLHLMNLVNLWDILQKLGMHFMSMPILGGLLRLQTSMDITTPFLLFFFLQAEKFGVRWNKYFRIFYLTITASAIFLSFSRYLIAVALVSVFLHGLTLKWQTLLKAACTALVLCFALVMSVGIDNTYTIIERRLYSKDNTVSDQTRVHQIDALMSEYWNAPLFGRGLGGYVKDMVRDNTLKHSYEVQWVAFFMQFGFFGILIILVPILLIFAKILTRPLSIVKFCYLFLFVIWLLSGFTNPFLISLASGIIYSLFLLSSQALNEKKETLLQTNALKSAGFK